MLFCLSVNYTPKGLEAMGKNPKTNRREAVEKLLNAAGGKMVSMYATIADGPGAMVIFDIDPAVAPAIVAVAASSDGRGRDGDFSAPPAQIPAGAANAPGSHLGW